MVTILFQTLQNVKFRRIIIPRDTHKTLEEVKVYANVNPAPGYAKHPDHEVHIVPFHGTIVVHADGTKIAESSAAVLVTESNHSPLYYFPLEDVNLDYLRDSGHIIRCPFKGKARYWNVRVGDHEIDNALWSLSLIHI